jgi:hypothetical protein
MPLQLPEPIERFIASENTHGCEAIEECFVPDATVRDEGRTRTGLNEIAAWRRETKARYRHTVKALAVANRAGKTVVTTELTGDFPGSPVTIDFVFQLNGDRIVSLQIGS